MLVMLTCVCLSYVSVQVVGNDQLFYGEPSYCKELSSIASLALQNLDDAIGQESHLVNALLIVDY